MGNKSDIIIIFPHLSRVMGIRVSNGSEFRCDRQDAALGNNITRNEDMDDLQLTFKSFDTISFEFATKVELSFHDNNFTGW